MNDNELEEHNSAIAPMPWYRNGVGAIKYRQHEG
jgi:hypothetical protein